MARTKTDKSIVMVFFNAMKIFCMNIHKFLLYMAFPVLGQIIGIFLIFGSSYWFNTNLNIIIEKYPVMNNLSSMTTAIIILALPGLLIFVKAFWDYLVAYGALNSMTESAMTTGRVYDFAAHNAVVKNRKFSFIMLWLVVGILSIFGLFPLLWIIAGIFFVYFVLIFQVFTFEHDITAIDCFRRSLEIIKGHFARTALLLILLGVVIYILYLGITVLFEIIKFNALFLKIFENWAMTLPLEQINSLYALLGVMITPKMIAQMCLTQLSGFIALGFLLPLRSITWTLWYKNLNTSTQGSETPRKSRKSSQKKLDKNILKRAMEEDEDI